MGAARLLPIEMWGEADLGVPLGAEPGLCWG